MSHKPSREELLVYGYIKEFYKANNVYLPPDDLMTLFVAWLKLLDSFDMNKIPSNIQFDSAVPTRVKRTSINPPAFLGVAGTFVVGKGMRQSWTFKIDKNAKYAQIGIMNDTMIQWLDVIEDNCDDIHKGYGIGIPRWIVYHSGDINGNLNVYANQFEMKQDFILLTMELDMTQTKGDHGILKYIINNDPKSDVKEIRTDGEYYNIAYDNIDINTKYRMTITFDRYCCNKWIELVNL